MGPYREGQKAFEDGKGLSNNPYQDGDNDFDEWEDGYCLTKYQSTFLEKE